MQTRQKAHAKHSLIGTGKPRPAGSAHDGVFCLAPMPGCGYTRGDGLGFAAGQSKGGRGQRLSFAAGAVGIKSFNSGAQRVVAVLARPVGGARLPPEWIEPLNRGLMAVVSANLTTTRLTDEVAMARNTLVAQLATTIVVAHASPGGRLASLVAQWRLERPHSVVELHF